MTAETLMMRFPAWTANVTREENSWSKKQENANPAEPEDHKATMSATNAKKKATGLTSAETSAEEEDAAILPPDPQVLPTQEEERARRRVPEERDLIPAIAAADLPPLLVPEPRKPREEEDLPLPNPLRKESVLTPETLKVPIRARA
jgi:hypothetical protein